MSTSSERRAIILRMRDKDMTYEEIGEIFGISKQRVHELATKEYDGFRKKSVQKIKYVGLRNWLLEHRMKICDFEKLCGLGHTSTIFRPNSNPCKRTIDAILKATGMTYEECFFEEKSESSE